MKGAIKQRVFYDVAGDDADDIRLHHQDRAGLPADIQSQPVRDNGQPVSSRLEHVHDSDK